MARSLDMTVCAWAPLEARLLTGKYTKKATGEDQGRLSRPDWGVSERGKKVAEEVDKVAEDLGRSAAQVALQLGPAATGSCHTDCWCDEAVSDEG